MQKTSWRKSRKKLKITNLPELKPSVASLSSSKVKFLQEGFGMMKSPTTSSELLFLPILFLRAFLESPCAPAPRREIVEIFHTFDVFFTCPNIFFHCRLLSSPANPLSISMAVKHPLDNSASRTPLGEGSSSLSSRFVGEYDSLSPFLAILPFLEDSVSRFLFFLCFLLPSSLSAWILERPF